jgi:hypothetical protein
MGASARPIHLTGSIGLIASSQRSRRAGGSCDNGPPAYAPVPVKCETSPPSPEASTGAYPFVLSGGAQVLVDESDATAASEILANRTDET